ncbi:MAG TPA: epoxide hydrolase [Anaeromyxobacteraceae bacterium]|nr:epoxide hydrolase [Anaeromyxobacteraceae bacterium]
MSILGLVLLAAAFRDRTALAAEAQVRPFHVDVPEKALLDLRQRIAATRWPDRETVADRSQGAQLAKLQALVRHWGTDYDWRKAETKLNALPQFMTTIDGLDVHFIHVRSRHKNALPVIITHGWPGSVLELIKVIGPLTDPTAHGGRAEDAFDVVIPSVPGYGFSGKPTGTGWDPDHIARAWAELTKRLGYTRYVAQGGDWGAPISSAMARQAPAGLLGIHLNLPATVPPEVAAALAGGGPTPAGLSEKERAVFEALMTYAKQGNSAYFVMMTARPQTVGYGATDSPAGLAAWILVHPGFAQWTYGADPEHIARAWAELMKRLGYTRYVAQGGDWGTPISSAMARQAAAGLLGIHINLPATVPPEVAAVLPMGGPAPEGLSEKERAVFDALVASGKKGNLAYFTMMTARPQTVGYGATDSPAGLAAWVLVHPGFAQWTYGAEPEKSPTKDDVLDDITLYWLTNTAASAARLYWENGARGSVVVAAAQKTGEISLPVAITVFPEDVYRPPETWARRAYRNLIYFNEVDRGGHFAAWEQPELFAAELRAAFKSLRPTQ